MIKTKVIAISGISGSGKTTIVKKLADEFNCPFLLFDDYVDNATYPDNMKSWFEKGADVSAIKTPKFVNALQKLISKSTSSFIFIEEPFGKERDVMASLIDAVILLDAPIELCLVRIIKRHIERGNSESLVSISSYLDKYQDHFRDIYLSTADQVRNNCDLVIREVNTIDDTSKIISDWLKSH